MLGPVLIALALAASPAPPAKKGKKKPPATAPAPAPAPGDVTPAAAASAPAEKQDVAPARKPTLSLEGMGRTPAEQKQLDDLQEMLRSYEAESRDFKRDVQLLVEKKYEEKRSDLSASYEKAIRDIEVTSARTGSTPSPSSRSSSSATPTSLATPRT